MDAVVLPKRRMRRHMNVARRAESDARRAMLSAMAATFDLERSRDLETDTEAADLGVQTDNVRSSSPTPSMIEAAASASSESAAAATAALERNPAKLLKALLTKLRQINQLETAARRGRTLSSDQYDTVSRKTEILLEIETVELGAGQIVMQSVVESVLAVSKRSKRLARAQTQQRGALLDS